MNLRLCLTVFAVLLTLSATRPQPGFACTPQNEAATAGTAHRLISGGQPLEGYLLLFVDDAPLAKLVRKAGFDHYLDGQKPLAEVRAAWTNAVSRIHAPDRQNLNAKFEILTQGLPEQYTAVSSTKLRHLGREVHVAIFDPARQPYLQAFVSAMQELKGLPSAEQKVKFASQMVTRRLGRGAEMTARTTESSPPAGFSRVGERLTRLPKDGGSNNDRMVLLKTALNAAGVEAVYKVVPYFENIRTTEWKPMGVEAKVGTQSSFVAIETFWTQDPIVEVRVEGTDLVIQKNNSAPVRVPGVVRSRPNALLQKPADLRIEGYPAGRPVHLFDGATGKILTDGVVVGPEGDGFRVNYGQGLSRVVSRAELDVLNAYLRIPDGTIVRAGEHFRQQEPGLVRADLVIDRKNDPILRSFLAEMDVIGRATAIPIDAKLQYVTRAVDAWMVPNYWSIPVAELERAYVNQGKPAPIGQFREGLCRHVAMMSTLALEQMGFHARYSSGRGHSSPHAYATVQLPDGRFLKVDPYFDAVMPLTNPKPPQGYLSEIIVGGKTYYEILGGKPAAVTEPATQQAARPARSPFTREAVHQAGGAAKFGVAYAINRGVTGAIETRSLEGFGAVAQEMTTREFWYSYWAFVGTARPTEAILGSARLQSKIPDRFKSFTKTGPSLAVGMAAAQAVTGQATVEGVGLSTATFYAAGTGVARILSPADALVRRSLGSVGTPGKVALGAYETAKLALVLAGGEQADRAGRAALAPLVPSFSGNHTVANRASSDKRGQ